MKIADYKKPSDWELFFKHRTRYIPLKLLEKKFNTTIDFNILICPDHIAKIDGSKETIIINVKEYHGVKDNFDYLEKQSAIADKNTWANALDIAFILYLDIINLLLEILEAMDS